MVLAFNCKVAKAYQKAILWLRYLMQIPIFFVHAVKEMVRYKSRLVAGGHVLPPPICIIILMSSVCHVSFSKGVPHPNNFMVVQRMHITYSIISWCKQLVEFEEEDLDLLLDAPSSMQSIINPASWKGNNTSSIVLPTDFILESVYNCIMSSTLLHLAAAVCPKSAKSLWDKYAA